MQLFIDSKKLLLQNAPEYSKNNSEDAGCFYFWVSPKLHYVPGFRRNDKYNLDIWFYKR